VVRGGVWFKSSRRHVDSKDEMSGGLRCMGDDNLRFQVWAF
jgi:hypothetical protein